MNLVSIQDAVIAPESSLNTHYWTLYSLTIGLQAKNVFEFGAGSSSRVLLAALGITNGRLMSCDVVDPRPNWRGRDEAAERRWQFCHMSSSAALDLVSSSDAFDLVLHDGSHEADELAHDVGRILPAMKRFGLMLVHDVEQADLGPQVRLGLMEGIRRTGLQTSLTSLPFSDGLAIVRVESHTGRGQIQTTWRKSTTRPACPTPMPWRSAYSTVRS